MEFIPPLLYPVDRTLDINNLLVHCTVTFSQELGPVLKKLKIAVVEDDPEIRSLLSTILCQRLSLPQPSLFNDGASFTRALTEDGLFFDVIIMDYRMPEMNGLDTAKLLRNRLKGAKIILTTGYDLKEEARSAGLLYLQKPFSTEELARIIEQDISTAS